MKYKDEYEYLDPFDNKWYPVTILRDEGGEKVKVESDITNHDYWADRSRLRLRRATLESNRFAVVEPDGTLKIYTQGRKEPISIGEFSPEDTKQLLSLLEKALESQ